MTNFSPRTSPPTIDNKCYYNYSYNPFYTSQLWTWCTWYAYGRIYEILGSKPDLSTGAASEWFSYNKNKYDKGNGGYPYSTNYSAAKVGAIACYANHVEVVEVVGSNGKPVGISMGGYNGASNPGEGMEFYIKNTKWKRWKQFRYKNDGSIKSGFVGYIYPLDKTPSNPLTATTTSGSWSVAIPANYRLSLYAGSTSANPLSKYVSAKASPYTVRCTQKAELSNGTTRYCGKFNGNDNYWFVLTSSMKVSDNSTSTPGTYYTIYFDYHGGSGSVSYGEFPVGAAFGTLPSATRSGYTFDGWYTAATGGQKVSATDKPASSGTLHAHWTKVPTSSGNSWTVTIPANYKLPLYASSTAANPTTKYVRAQSKPYQIHCTQKVTRSNGQIRYYASFDGGKNNLWFIYTSRMSVTQNGSSTGSYTIRFSANGGSVSPSSKTVTAGSTYGTLPTPTRSGYTFDGWYTSASGGTEVTASGKPTSSRTLYAHWKKVISYTIRFNANGGSVSPSSKTITAGSTYGTLPIPTRSGYSFDGWHTSASGGTKIAASDKPTSSRTLYAHWSSKPSSSEPTVTKGNWLVTIPANYKLEFDGASSGHYYPKSTPYDMVCDMEWVYPDGKIEYFFSNTFLGSCYFQFTSDMKVEPVDICYVSGTGGKNLAINSRPSASYPTGTSIPMGAYCFIYPSKSSGNWLFVKYDASIGDEPDIQGKTGYVYKKYITKGYPTIRIGTVYGTNGALAINSKPSAGSQIGRIPNGSWCRVYTGMSSGNWYWVKYNGVYGYAHKNYIRL